MPGVGISMVIFAVGAILDFAITVSPDQHGINLNAVGVILMIVGGVGFVLSLLLWGTGGVARWRGARRRTTVVEDAPPTLAEDRRSANRRPDDVYR
ncbi:MAG: hypothetical protein J2P57_13150 [Acidimicrobiaceae bacterium]|nr:hypothetical protein [Acidimicrobiaceae bacterium]